MLLASGGAYLLTAGALLTPRRFNPPTLAQMSLLGTGTAATAEEAAAAKAAASAGTPFSGAEVHAPVSIEGPTPA